MRKGNKILGKVGDRKGSNDEILFRMIFAFIAMVNVIERMQDENFCWLK